MRDRRPRSSLGPQCLASITGSEPSLGLAVGCLPGGQGKAALEVPVEAVELPCQGCTYTIDDERVDDSDGPTGPGLERLLSPRSGIITARSKFIDVQARGMLYRASWGCHVDFGDWTLEDECCGIHQQCGQDKESLYYIRAHVRGYLTLGGGMVSSSTYIVANQLTFGPTRQCRTDIAPCAANDGRHS